MEKENEIKNKFQKEALHNFIDHYYNKKEKRGILCACCGYGKSYLIYKIIKECINNRGEKLFIIATSRIKLIEQLGPDLDKWNKNDKNKWKLQISILCSEDISSSGKKFNIRQEEIIDKINNKNNTINIFLTTYNSAKKIVDEISKYNKKIENTDSNSENYLEEIEPDLIILDEAHNTVGCGKNKDKYHQELFKINENFNASKYLFMTATPLKMIHKNPFSKINTNETIYSMDNANTYGKTFYYFSFSKAIENKLITNFKTIFLEQNKDLCIPDNIKNQIENISSNEKDKQYFNEISSLLVQSMNEYKFIKTIIYISNKTKAQLLKDILEKLQKEFNKKSSKFVFETYKIVDDMSYSDKKKEQYKFEKSTRAFLISVNIFNEGVDIPCVDSVMFAEERFSQTTIVQNIGRCLRLDQNNKNKIGYVIIPNILYEIGVDKNEFYSSKFKTIRKCISIIKNEKSQYFFTKLTNNKKILDNDNDNDNDNEEIDNDNIENNNLDNNTKNNIELLKYFTITGTFDGFISNTTLNEIRDKYVIQCKIDNIKNYAFSVKKDKNNHWLRLDLDYKNEWISWNYFFTNIEPPKYEDTKKIFDKLKNNELVIKIWNNFLDIYDYILSIEMDEEFDYDKLPFKNINIDKIDKLKRKNIQKYYEIINLIFTIPNQPEKYYKSTNSWISIEDFIGSNVDINKINNTLKLNKSLVNENNTNLKNLINNDNMKVKKGKWNNIDINLPKLLQIELKKENIYDETKINFVVQYRLNKNNIYDTSIVLLEDKVNKNIIGKIYLEENKIDYQKNNDNIFNSSLYFDNDIKEEINNFINIIKLKCNKEKEVTIEDEFEELIKEGNKIVNKNKRVHSYQKLLSST